MAINPKQALAEWKPHLVFMTRPPDWCFLTPSAVTRLSTLGASKTRSTFHLARGQGPGAQGLAEGWG